MERDSQSVVTRQLLCLAPYYLINLSVGLVQGLTMVQVVPLVEGEDVVVLDQERLSWLVSLGAVGAVVGHLAGGVAADKLGRRRAALLTCPLFMAGFLLSGLAQITPVLFMGKLLGGLCCGLQASPCSSYYTEVSSPVVMCLHVTCRPPPPS